MKPEFDAEILKGAELIIKSITEQMVAEIVAKHSSTFLSEIVKAAIGMGTGTGMGVLESAGKDNPLVTTIRREPRDEAVKQTLAWIGENAGEIRQLVEKAIKGILTPELILANTVKAVERMRLDFAPFQVRGELDLNPADEQD